MLTSESISSFRESSLSILASKRPWHEFFDLFAYNLPSSLSAATSRIKQNLTHFLVNYLIIVLVIIIPSLLYQPVSLIVFLIVLIAWFYLFFYRDQPLEIFGFTIDDRVLLLGLGVITVVSLVWAQVWLNLVVSIVIWVFVILLHAVFRSTDGLATDDQESPYRALFSVGDDDSPGGDYSPT